jgi:hypothetical protein
MKHLEDKRLCPYCLHELHVQPYLMSRRADKNVLTFKQILWLLVFILLFVVIGLSGG